MNTSIQICLWVALVCLSFDSIDAMYLTKKLGTDPINILLTALAPMSWGTTYAIFAYFVVFES